jgi:hypothetical protein
MLVVDWYDVTEACHKRTFAHECALSSLPAEWQRELASLWRLEADVNNGGYLQFLSNWGNESYTYARQALEKIGARRMAEIIEQCQALVDEHFDSANAPPERLSHLLPNRIIDAHDGTLVKKPGSILPDNVVARVYELSYEFMDYPDDLASLGLKYYRCHIESDGGNQEKAVVLPFAEWQQIAEELEELEDIRSFDEAKSEPSDPVPFEDVRRIERGESP